MTRSEINNPMSFMKHLCDRVSSVKRDLDHAVEFNKAPRGIDYNLALAGLDQAREAIGRIGAEMVIEWHRGSPQEKVNRGLDEDK